MKLFLSVLFLLGTGFTVFSQNKTENGIDLYRQGNFEKAVEVLKAVTEANKNDKFAWVYLGAAYAKAGQKKLAVAAFDKQKVGPLDLVPGDDAAVSDLKKAFAGYTEQARVNNATGTVKLAVELLADGKIGVVFVVKSLPYGLTEQSIAAAKKITFKPAEKNGKPVTTVAIFEYTFHIY